MLNFLPLLAERFARQRLRALAQVEGKHNDGVPVVLFLCTHNAGRSQMALGFFAHLAGDCAIAWSGGSDPADQINPAAIAAMAERGIDIASEYPKPWTDEVVRAADVVVTMGCGDACPVFPGHRYLDWAVDDPAGLDLPRGAAHPRRHRTPRPRLARRDARPRACLRPTSTPTGPWWRRWRVGCWPSSSAPGCSSPSSSAPASPPNNCPPPTPGCNCCRTR